MVIGMINKLLLPLGLSVKPVGKEFMGSRETVRSARKLNMTINDYIESIADNEKKRGRRDRVIAMMMDAGCLKECRRVLEIGPGTGRYTEAVINVCRPTDYEIYETNIGWRNYIKNSMQTKCTKIYDYTCDGITLSLTERDSVDLVHAHAVFVYLPLLQSLHYIEEMIRVAKNGAFIVFDYIEAESFTSEVADAWMKGPHSWPVLIPSNLIRQLATNLNLTFRFGNKEAYGCSFVQYVILRKSHI